MNGILFLGGLALVAYADWRIAIGVFVMTVAQNRALFAVIRREAKLWSNK